jgi:3-methyl-2-oxobutanoate hydroxymethyltransferase
VRGRAEPSIAVILGVDAHARGRDRGQGALLIWARKQSIASAKPYRNFRAEFERLQQERIAAFKEFRSDVETRAYPEARHCVPIAESEFKEFLKGLPN